MSKFKWIFAGILLTMSMIFAGCGGDDEEGGGLPDDIGENNPNVIVALGDSITQGFGDGGAPYPSRVANITGLTVYNEGRGGERSGGGAGRVSGVLSRYKPAYLLILYGANDAIAGADVESVIGNLRAIIGAAQANKTVPVLANLTPMYDGRALFNGKVDEYNPRIRDLASETGARFVNLSGEFGDERSLIQADGLHPTDSGNQVIAFAFSDRI